MIIPQQGHIDVGLSNVSIMTRNADFVIEQVLPMMPSDKQSDKYWIYGQDNLRPVDDQRPPAAESNQAELTVQASNPFVCESHALHDWVPWETDEGVDEPLDPQIDTTLMLTDIINLNKEMNGVNALVSALSPIDLSASSYANAWDNPDIDPISVIDKDKETVATACGKRPNVLTLSRPVFRGMRNNPTVKARVAGALSGIDVTRITAAQLAVVCEVDQIIVADGIVNTAKKGQAVSNSYIWQRYALLSYRPPQPGIRMMSLGYMFRWMKGKLAAQVTVENVLRRHATRIEAQQYYVPTITAASAAVMYTNTTQN